MLLGILWWCSGRRALIAGMFTPVLYSFRRCPYAIRARMAIDCAGVQVELREVSLRSPPAAMVRLSPKATVPVLVCGEGPDAVLDESLDIMNWALSHGDPDSWRSVAGGDEQHPLVCENDTGLHHHQFPARRLVYITKFVIVIGLCDALQPQISGVVICR